MDPDATFEILDDDEAPLGERAQAAEALFGWLDHGGFIPAGIASRDRLMGFCRGFIAAVEAVRSMPELLQLRVDLGHYTEKNTHHVADSSARLVEVLSD
jgi:hypothetical protein